MPYYFSQVIAIQYTDIKYLETQKIKYVRELKTEAANDRLDTINYRGYVSGAADNKIHCENLEKSAQATLTTAGKKFINRDIHE